MPGRRTPSRSLRGKDVLARLDGWRVLLRRHVLQTRHILRKLLVEVVVFTPRTDHYAFGASVDSASWWVAWWTLPDNDALRMFGEYAV